MSEAVLDARAVPATAGSHCRGLVAVHPVQADDGRRQPKDGAQEGKSDIRLPLGTAVDAAVERDTTPVEDVAAGAIEPVDQEAKADEPADGDDDIGWPVDEGAAEGEQPNDGQQDRKCRDDFGIDEAALVPRRATGHRVEVVAREARDDGCEDQFPDAEDYGKEVGEDHDDDWVEETALDGVCCRG